MVKGRPLPLTALTPQRWRQLVAEDTGLGERRVKMVMDSLVKIAIDHLERGEIIHWPGLFSAETWIAKPFSRNLGAVEKGQKVGTSTERKLYNFPPLRRVKIFPQPALKKKIAKATPPGSEPTREPAINWRRRLKQDQLKAQQEADQEKEEVQGDDVCP